MGEGREISPEGASYASSMAIEEGCLTAGNVFALISVGMVIIGHPHFSFFAVCVEANRMSAGRSWKLRHFVVGMVWILLVVDTSKSWIVESTSQGVASVKSAYCAFRIY